jgi:hypothetical protein
MGATGCASGHSRIGLVAFEGVRPDRPSTTVPIPILVAPARMAMGISAYVVAFLTLDSCRMPLLRCLLVDYLRVHDVANFGPHLGGSTSRVRQLFAVLYCVELHGMP